MEFLFAGLLWILGEFLWQLVAEVVLEGIFLLLDTVWVQRSKLPESWSRVQLLVAAFLGPVAGAVSALVVPHRTVQALSLRVLSWIALPLLGGASMALLNRGLAPEDRRAAGRLGWLAGVLFAVGFLAARRWGLD